MYTTTTAVITLLADDYDQVTNLQQHIDTAYVTLARVLTCASRKKITYDAATKEILERWMAAHCYTQSDKAYANRTTAGGSGTFQGQTGQGWESSNYGQMACRLDWSGCLFNLDKQQRASGKAICG